jgi:hypothetical protein
VGGEGGGESEKGSVAGWGWGVGFVVTS